MHRSTFYCYTDRQWNHSNRSGTDLDMNSWKWNKCVMLLGFNCASKRTLLLHMSELYACTSLIQCSISGEVIIRRQRFLRDAYLCESHRMRMQKYPYNSSTGNGMYMSAVFRTEPSRTADNAIIYQWQRWHWRIRRRYSTQRIGHWQRLPLWLCRRQHGLSGFQKRIGGVQFERSKVIPPTPFTLI